MMPVLNRTVFLAGLALALALVQSRPAAAQVIGNGALPGLGSGPGPGDAPESEHPLIDRYRRRVAERYSRENQANIPFGGGLPIMTPPPAENRDETSAVIRVRVPAEAELLFNNIKTTKRGEQRRFVTPPLDQDRRYSYDVIARWTEAGKPVEQKKTIQLYAGDQLTVDFFPETSAPTPKDKK